MEFDLEYRPSYWRSSRHVASSSRASGLPVLGTAPGFGTGEHLPSLQPREVEIAAVGLESTTGDVISVSAREDNGGIRVRIVDEYGTRFRLKNPVRDQPLSMAELIEIIDTARHDGLVGLVEAFLDLNCGDPCGPDERLALQDFVQVTSDYYPQLESYYAARVKDWIERES